jgi:hypothetical protein
VRHRLRRDVFLVSAAFVALLVVGTTAWARTTVYLACGTQRSLIPSTKHVAPRSCAMWAYAVDIYQYMDVRFRHLRWRQWGTSHATARGQYSVSGSPWQPVSLTAYARFRLYGRLPGVFYTRLRGIDTCRCGFIGPSRGFTLDTTPFE